VCRESKKERARARVRDGGVCREMKKVREGGREGGRDGGTRRVGVRENKNKQQRSSVDVRTARDCSCVCVCVCVCARRVDMLPSAWPFARGLGEAFSFFSRTARAFVQRCAVLLLRSRVRLRHAAKRGDTQQCCGMWVGHVVTSVQ
jgi:hypothetical protein